MTNLEINCYLDHAVLKPEISREEALDAMKLGIKYKVRTLCVRPCDIDLAVELCKGTETDVCTVVGFPHGVVPSSIKAEEAKLYIKQGVSEIDMVANYSYIKSGDWELVEKDIRAVSEITRASNIVLKVILEANMLTVDEITRATEVSVKAQADFVKTSTGFNGSGATEEAVQAMIKAADGRIKVKPSGGIRDAQSARRFIEMGSHRLGVGYTSTPAICDGGDTAGSKNSGY